MFRQNVLLLLVWDAVLVELNREQGNMNVCGPKRASEAWLI